MAAGSKDDRKKFVSREKNKMDIHLPFYKCWLTEFYYYDLYWIIEKYLRFFLAGDQQQSAILDQNGAPLQQQQPDLSQLSEDERAHIQQVGVHKHTKNISKR